MFGITIVKGNHAVWVDVAMQVDVEFVNGNAVQGCIFFGGQALAGGQSTEHHFYGIHIVDGGAAVWLVHFDDVVPDGAGNGRCCRKHMRRSGESRCRHRC